MGSMSDYAKPMEKLIHYFHSLIAELFAEETFVISREKVVKCRVLGGICMFTSHSGTGVRPQERFSRTGKAGP